MDLSLEMSVEGPVCGVDEAGRGPLAGPVVAAAVILDPKRIPAGLGDSKALSKTRRESLATQIWAHAEVGLGVAEPEEIDRLNILHASMVAMARAVVALGPHVAFALIDGNRLPKLTIPAQALVKGDARCASIAAASIVAKVHRDELMVQAHRRYPDYGFDANAGYPSPAHKQALASHGPTPLHRKSFRPVQEAWHEFRSL